MNDTNKKTRLDLLREKEAKLAAQIAAIEARQSAKERKERAARLILVGTAVETHAAQDADFARQLAAIIDRRTTRPVDRKRLGLKVD